MAARSGYSIPPFAPALARSYASLSPDAPPPTRPYDVFDEDGKARQRDRAVLRLREAAVKGEVSGPEVLDYLREEVADRLAERVEVCHLPFILAPSSYYHTLLAGWWRNKD